jgi:hypothetical protein
MAGSLTYREYESDHSIFYSIQVDKSNDSLKTGYTGQTLCNVRGSNWKLPPKSLILRRVHCFSQLNPLQKRSFIVGNKSVISSPFMEIGQEYIPNNDNTYSWIITGYTGERFTVPQFINQADTGLTDGTP